MTSKTALISVSNKSGVVDFAQSLVAAGYKIVSSGGTAKLLQESNLPVSAVSDYTGSPEILGGRVKTLHPRVHGGILAKDNPEHRGDLDAIGADLIDLVCVNLYPFAETIGKEGVTLSDAIEQIDIGGPTMVRAAAKNFSRVTVVVDPGDYSEIARLANEDGLDRATRLRLSKKAFAHTAQYDGMIARYLESQDETGQVLPETWVANWGLGVTLRYGENPHQEAGLYRNGTSWLDATQLQGKALSYNNILDIDAAFLCCREFDETAAVVVKHTNPCGVATAGSLLAAYQNARAGDPISAFGGIVALNRQVTKDVAEELVTTFLECVIAPEFDDAALEVLSKKKNLRVLSYGAWPKVPEQFSLRSVSGGVLVQQEDRKLVAARDGKVVTKRAPSTEELASLDFVWRVGKHVKSNAIVYGHGTRTLGIGAGQMSRVDAAELAVKKATGSLKGSAVASDAFFPFRDAVDAIAASGATAIIQPGGSIRDEEVIQAADENNLAMVFTSTRHFRH